MKALPLRDSMPLLTTLGVVAALLAIGLLACWHYSRETTIHLPRSFGPVFTNTVDWYRPLPEPSNNIEEVDLPESMVTLVAPPAMEEAMTMLESVDVIALNEDKLSYFSRITDPEAVLESHIEALQKRGRERRKDDDLVAEIHQLTTWQQHLQPYLARAVMLEAGGTWGARLIAEDILIHFTAMSDKPAPMRKAAVVIFYLRSQSRYTQTSE